MDNSITKVDLFLISQLVELGQNEYFTEIHEGQKLLMDYHKSE